MNDPLAPLPEERTPSPEPSPSPLDAAITKAPEDRVKETSTRDSSVAARAQSTQDNATSPLDITAEEPPESDEGQRSSVDVEMSAKPEEDAQSPSEAVEDTRPQDWLDLPMLVKLDSMHALTEWQFHNVNRFRSTMRSDDEYASWVRDRESHALILCSLLELYRGSNQLAMTPRAMHTGSLQASYCRGPPTARPTCSSILQTTACGYNGNHRRRGVHASGSAFPRPSHPAVNRNAPRSTPANGVM